MKDFKLPIISEENRKKIWDNLKTGDKLISFEHGGWDNDLYIRNYIVVKKTPSGSVRLNNNILLKTFHSSLFIESNELTDCISKIKLQEEVMRLLFEVNRNKRKFKENLRYEDTIKLKEILENVIII